MSLRARLASQAGALALAGLIAAPAGAQTLAEAIALAYQNNPTLRGQRAQLRGLDEDYVQAAAGLRPTVGFQGVASYSQTRLGKDSIASASVYSPSPATRQESNLLNTQLVLTQPLYTGGRVTAEIRSAQGRIAAGREVLRSTEGDLLLNVVDAYTSVRRDLDIQRVRQAALEALLRQADEAKARRTAGDATLTDVAQAEAQLEGERALYAQAQQQLQASRNDFTTLVGEAPDALELEPALPDLPTTVEEAFERAETYNPDLQAAIFTEAASRAAVAAARDSRRPTVTAQATYGYQGPATPFYGQNLNRNLTAEAVVNLPLYTGGLDSSTIRRAIEQNNSDREAVEAQRRAVVQNVGNSWNGLLTARRNVATQGRQVAAASTAYEGMQVEYRSGQRSTFEVLYAEATLRNAEVLLLQARHDAFYAAAAVLRAMGGLEVRSLTTGVALYDPAINFRAVKSAFAPPWDPAIRALDRLGAAGSGHRLPRGAEPSPSPSVKAADGGPSETAPLEVQLPTDPVALKTAR